MVLLDEKVLKVNISKSNDFESIKTFEEAIRTVVKQTGKVIQSEYDVLVEYESIELGCFTYT
ncbi:hypothetical protein [Pueribacillus sp. YX66]|uniref:hypothetical protein n=1 Tax=Pueribacillus sp. YX66 TaxID=3229242 RepID=UPI0036D27F8F